VEAVSIPSSFTIAAAGTGLCFTLDADGMPVVTHWGAMVEGEDLAEQLAATAEPSVMHSSLDTPRQVTVLPGEREGWSGVPGLELHRGARAVLPRFVLSDSAVTATSVRFALLDEAAGVEVRLLYELDRFGVLSVTATVTNTAADADLEVDAVRILLPLPPVADQLLDFTGRWSGERLPQRSSITDGTRLRAARRGRTGHDSPFLSMAGTHGFGFASGEVWATHVAWSGNSEYIVERLAEGAGVLAALTGGGELLMRGEVVLTPGGSYQSAPVLFTHSQDGIDGLSARLHARVRDSAAYPSAPRPLVLNTWEAVYFDHDLERLVALADVAAKVGVERFVLDDGWFSRRRDDTVGLGDWTVDPAVWPNGLRPLADAVRERGMSFGLWFEPEMVNLGSQIAEDHPDWLLAPRPVGRSWRFQHVLNLAHPEAWEHLLSAISGLVDEVGIDFLKWDHNRDLHESIDRVSWRWGVRAQTLATYALMDELHRRHPGLEIESCASGGARVDLGILARTQRIWASDTNDAIERQKIQRWTGVLVPPELVGSHVGPRRAHTTARELDLPFRLITALFGHAGIEWDISRCDPEELAALTRWASLYKRVRPLLASGRTVRADAVPDGALLHGIVAQDGSRGLFAWVQLEAGPLAGSQRARIPGLDVGRTYRVELTEPFGPASRRSIADPAWLSGPVRPFSGALLSVAGLPLPVLNPGQAVLLEVTSVPQEPPAT
jgi:alpha-galactosidase